MQRIVQINIAGRVLPVEEDAYVMLKEYITTLERQFTGEAGHDEIIQDIENRIAELFAIRLQSGAPAIDRTDVQKVTETLGAASDFDSAASGSFGAASNTLPVRYIRQQRQQSSGQPLGGGYQPPVNSRQRIFRNPNDKVIGGVCSGIANYFDVDPVIVRLVWVTFVFLGGVGLLAYIISWIVIPVAKTPEDLAQLSGGAPMNFHDITRNVGNELQDLKQRGEEMSRELRDFFSRRK